MSNKIVDISGLERFFDNIKNYISGILSNKVDKVQGKDLSTEDFTTELKSKLSQVNILAEDAKTTIDDINKDTYIKYVVQSLTDTQKEQARKNIGVNNKQDALVSGTNIKTINGTSILGSGNIISGYKTVQHISESTISLSPNIYYIKDNTSSTLTISFNAAENNTIMNEYFIKFNTASSGTSVSLPNTIKWVDGQIPEFENDCTYQISVIDDLGVCVKFI